MLMNRIPKSEPPRRLTKAQRIRAEALLRGATDLQGAFWDAVLELECALDVRIDTNRDLSDWDIDRLHSGAEDDCGPASWVPR